MKLTVLLFGIFIASSSFAFEKEMCAEVYPTEVTECEEFIVGKNFEKIPVELCQFRISKGEMLTCYKAIANKTYKYDVILQCASTHRYGIPVCLEDSGTLITP